MTNRIAAQKLIARACLIALFIAIVWASVFVQDALSKGVHAYARWTCPCMFYEQRDFEYCLATLPSGSAEVPGFVNFDIDRTKQRVTVSALGIARASAVRVPGRQCVMDE